MQRQGATWYCLAALAMLSSCGVDVFADAGADKKDTTPPLPAEIVTAWHDAGATVGWMKRSPMERPKFQDQEQAAAGAMPVFQFSEWKEGSLAKLPDPGVPFGLSLNATQVTDPGLKELAGLKSLHALYLNRTRLTDAGLKELAGFKNLQILDVRNNKITDAGLKDVGGLTSLQELYLNHDLVTDLAPIAGLTNLRTLNLGGTNVADTGVKGIAGLRSLQELTMWGTAVADAGLKDIAGLKNLQTLDLTDTNVTDAGLKELAGMQSLRGLMLVMLPRVTAGGAAALRKELPACQIYH